MHSALGGPMPNLAPSPGMLAAFLGCVTIISMTFVSLVSVAAAQCWLRLSASLYSCFVLWGGVRAACPPSAPAAAAFCRP